jgi:tetratricopeptide (TPR) repeat protein
MITRLRGSRKGEAVHYAVGPLMSLAYSSFQQGDYVGARQLLLKALEHRNEIQDMAVVVWVLSGLALTWDHSEQYRERTEFFSNYLQRYPNDAIAYTLRGGSHWYSGDLQKAIVDYSKALELAPADPLALTGRGQVFVEHGEVDRAIQDLDAALANMEQTSISDPAWRTAVQAYVLNGRAAGYGARGEFDRALNEFEKSISLCPENAWVYYNRALTYEHRGDNASAAADYKRALAMKSPKLNTLRRKYAETKVKALLG